MSTSLTVPCSTTWPAYMTITLSTISATTPRSWVISISAAPVRSWIALSSSRIWAWTVTSSAVVGSSAMSSLGSHESAMPIMTRWRMPPDSSCGYCLARRSGLGMPTQAEHLDGPVLGLLVLDLHVELDLLRDLVADGEHRVQARQRLLEDHRHLVAAEAGASRSRAATGSPGRRTRSRCPRRSRPAGCPAGA